MTKNVHLHFEIKKLEKDSHLHLHIHGSPGPAEAGFTARESRESLPGPAELNPTEARLMHLLGDAYGDGLEIVLAKDDPKFETKRQALKAAGRTFDETRGPDNAEGAWVHK